MPFCYKRGNNQIIKFNCSSTQTNIIKKDNSIKSYVAQFLNTGSKIGEVIIQGELKNRCKGEWICNLTDEEIESLIPNDYKYNKNKFYQIAKRIIQEYDNMHQNDLIKLPDVVKIGKWVNKNVKYNINYTGRNDVTATDTFNNLEGVCDHFTKSFLCSESYS